MTFQERWNAEESLIGKIAHKYISILLVICGTAPELLSWFGMLPTGTVPQGFWTAGLIAGILAKVGGKLTVK